MKTYLAKPDAGLFLGRQGENEARKIQFDISGWMETYGPGVVQLLVQRHGEDTPYPVPLEVDGNLSAWTISSADTAIHGDGGKAELQYYVDAALVKSGIWSTYVADSLGEAGEEVPEGYQSWVDKVLQAGADAQSGAERAEQAEQAATESEQNAAASETNAAEAAKQAVKAAEAAEKNAEQIAYSGAVYVGSGDMPEGYVLQIDPDSDINVDWVATTEAVMTEICPETTATLQSKNTTSISGALGVWPIEGGNAVVVWDGVEYQCTVHYDLYFGMLPCWVVGNTGIAANINSAMLSSIEDTGEPFLFIECGNFNDVNALSLLAIAQTAGEYTFSIQAEVLEYNQIPAEFIPDEAKPGSVTLDESDTHSGMANKAAMAIVAGKTAILQNASSFLKVIGAYNDSDFPNVLFAGSPSGIPGVFWRGKAIGIASTDTPLPMLMPNALYLYSANGTRYEITVDNDGNLTATEVT